MAQVLRSQTLMRKVRAAAESHSTKQARSSYFSVVEMPIKIASSTNPPNAPKPQPQNPFEAQKKLVEQNLQDVKKVIAIHSGKGGVGKSFFSVNLAVTLAKLGFKVGLIDADVDCPSCHHLLGKNERVFADEKQRLHPLQVYG